PRTKSAITAGTVVSKPTTSSMPRSFGSARVKPLEVMPTTAHCVHVFGEVEQVRANAADLAQVRERVRLRRHVTVRRDERQSEDRRIILRRTAGIADFDD